VLLLTFRDTGLLVFSTNWDQNSGFHKVSQNSSLIRFLLQVASFMYIHYYFQVCVKIEVLC
jgi:hypothetical protein